MSRPKPDASSVGVTVELQGGLAALFNGETVLHTRVPLGHPPTGAGTGDDDDAPAVPLSAVLAWVIQELMPDRSKADLLASGSTVRPGVLAREEDVGRRAPGRMERDSWRQGGAADTRVLSAHVPIPSPRCLPCQLRPPTQVVVNDVDWELTGRDATEIYEGDRVAFISTLHGG